MRGLLIPSPDGLQRTSLRHRNRDISQDTAGYATANGKGRREGKTELKICQGGGRPGQEAYRYCAIPEAALHWASIVEGTLRDDKLLQADRGQATDGAGLEGRCCNIAAGGVSATTHSRRPSPSVPLFHMFLGWLPKCSRVQGFGVAGQDASHYNSTMTPPARSTSPPFLVLISSTGTKLTSNLEQSLLRHKLLVN